MVPLNIGQNGQIPPKMESMALRSRVDIAYDGVHRGIGTLPKGQTPGGVWHPISFQLFAESISRNLSYKHAPGDGRGPPGESWSFISTVLVVRGSRQAEIISTTD